MEERKDIWHKILILSGAAALAVGGFLLFSSFTYRIGFPLDDAWIHQTYARNLAQLGEWSFVPGKPSAGSTSPFWSVLLALGYLLRINPFVWAFLIGGLGLLGLGIVGEKLFQHLVPSISSYFPWVGLLLVFEWHMIWSAASGMETIFHAVVICLVFYLISRENGNWFWIGLVIGMTAWVRPDGITLLGPAGFVLLIWRKRKGKPIKDLVKLGFGFLVGFAPYLLFNYLLSDSLWPNTFYAKQTEYAVLYDSPLIMRLFSLVRLPMIGVGIMLLPGLGMALWKSVRDRESVPAAMFLWWFGYTAVYALRLPVTYQHGRYLMPAMPVYFILSLTGVFEIIQHLSKAGSFQTVVKRVWLISLAAIEIGFYLMGGKQYAEDVAIIETEMVSTAHWIRENTEKDALIAVHDIGAVGYYAERDILDLAGLVSPEVIPFMREEDKLADFLTSKDVDYLVVFPDWYQKLDEMSKRIYQTDAAFSPSAGGENMAVYEWLMP